MKRREFLKLSAATFAAASVQSKLSFAAGSRSINPLADRWHPREGMKKPNIAVIVLDDIGFSDLGCYGAEYNTSAIDGLSKDGIRFNNFHVTALCAPTRACLLTGRNAHAVGVGNIAEWGRDLPGYHGKITKDAATLAEYLHADAYTTLAIGKWHLSAIHDQNGSGPYDHWPTGRGFDRWYGFHGNAIDHWHPEVFENTIAVYPEKNKDYHLSSDLVDRSIDYVKDHLGATPANPFFLYLAFGACHFPLHAPADDIRRHRGKYDKGWDQIREERYQRQREMNLIPEHARLSPRNENVPAWSSLNSQQKKIAVYGQEVYAAFLEHTDKQIARFVDFLKMEGQYDDTIIVVMSDNGAAGSGTFKEGIMDVRRSYYDDEPFTEKVEHFHKLGTDDSYGMYANGWAHAGNTPLKWYKSDTYGGGTRAPLIVTWPNGEIGKNKIQDQYHHVIDVVPSLFEMINKEQPETVGSLNVLPIQGTSFAYIFDTPEAEGNKHIQYFETAGDRAIWVDGWKAVTRHIKGDNYADDEWELFHTSSDFSEINNLAKQEPELLKKLINIWHKEAARDNVLPMEDDLFRLYQEIVPKPRKQYLFYPGMTRLDRLSAPDIYTYNSRFIIAVALTSNQASGVILASGDSGCGYEIYMKNGYLYFEYLYTRFKKYTFRSIKQISSSITKLELTINKTGEKSAELGMYANGKRINTMPLPNMWPIYSPNSGIRCGENRHAPISRAYKGSYPFNQKLVRVTVELDI